MSSFFPSFFCHLSNFISPVFSRRRSLW
jgi:hypothetical protein